MVWRDQGQREHIARDPYTFGPQLGDLDLHLFGEGRHRHAYRFLGAHEHEVEGVGGVLFAVWAPNAERVSVVGDFNRWDGRQHPMRLRGGSGVWELFIPDLEAGTSTSMKSATATAASFFSRPIPTASDRNCARGRHPSWSSASTFAWDDHGWLEARRNADWQHQPMSIYEVHLGSWQRDAGGRSSSTTANWPIGWQPM